MSFVYFAFSKEANLMKIGRSKTPIHRVKSLKPKSAIVAVVEESALSEKSAHKSFDDRRQHGEWFDVSKEQVLEFLSENKIPKVRPTGNTTSKIGVDQALHKRLKVQAAKESRSIQSLVFILLTEALDNLEVPETSSISPEDRKPNPNPTTA